MDTQDICIEDYNYDLPEERIAKHPANQRGQSRLLVYDKGHITDTVFSDLPELLPKDSLLFYNNTKVIQARLHFHKETGALIEIFCLEPHYPKDYERIFMQKGYCEWTCLIGNRKKWKSGTLSSHLQVNGQDIQLKALSRGQDDGGNEIVGLEWDNHTVSFSELLDVVGELPIPPYLNRGTEEADKRDYQTVYSKIDGSVAAPTAGLHFTEQILQAIDNKGIERNEITLHVSAGTFKPVKCEKIAQHDMHSEYIHVSKQSIEALLKHQGECTAVGTTSVRTIESLYYIGQYLSQHPQATEEELCVNQWTPYETSKETAIGPTEALQHILDYLNNNHMEALHTHTQIMIAPGYRYHYVKRIITNFHMPKSTLLLLVSAFIGEDWKRVYRYALDNGFQFLSYGDSSLLVP